MDSTEKMVLRRRRQHLADTIQITDDLLGDMLSNGLLDKEAIREIQLERSNQTRVTRMLDILSSCKPSEDVACFAAFCSVLNTDYKWLSRDLVVDLRVERGEVQADTQTLEEAAVFVHRKFGTSKRFSETDKKDMSEMIAVKLIIARDEWQKDLNRLTDTLNDERIARQRREEVALKLADIQRKFVRTHESQLVSHAHDMETTREFIKRILNDPMGSDVLFQFKDNLEKFLRQVSMALNQRDALFYEKEKCLKMLGAKVGPRVQLDEIISRLTDKSVNANMEVEDKDEVIKRLKKRVEELERQSGTYANSVGEFRKQLAERDREIAKIRRMIQIE